MRRVISQPVLKGPNVLLRALQHVTRRRAAGARTGVASVMRDAGGAQTSGRQRLARVLMAAQITLSFVLVAGAVLLARSMPTYKHATE